MSTYISYSYSCVSEFSRRIVILGKTGAGKSSLANTLFKENVFAANHTPESGTIECQTKSKNVNGKKIFFVDTPGFFDTKRSEEEMKPVVLKCITECAPGPHVFLIVLRVDKFTEQEKAIVETLSSYFSEEALKYATVLFTHGDQLPEGETIEEFVSQSEDLNNLVKKCGGRCNVIDNKYWNNNPQDDYRSNKFQVNKLLNTIDKIIEANNKSYYTSDFLQAVNKKIEEEKERIKESSANLSPDVILEQARASVSGKLLHNTAGVTSGVLLKVFLSGALKIVREGEPVLGLGAALTAAIAATIAGAAAEVPAILDAIE